MPSVVIPACNEAAGIERTLRSLLVDGIPDLEIVVVVNASSDRTAEIASDVDPGVTVIEIPTPGKSNALNVGEDAVGTFPRVFLDADVRLEPGTLTAIIEAASESHPIVAPELAYDEAGCSLAVRLYNRTERFHDYFGRGAPNASGCYAVSTAGRSRWEAFPDVISDDGFVENHFAPGESRTVVGHRAVVRPPRDLSSLITVRARIRRGMIQLARRFPRLVGKHPSQVGGVLRRMLWRPWTWASLLLYCFVRACEHLLARRQIARGEEGWGRDETSRTAD